MNIKQTALAAALALLPFGPAQAEGLKPFQGRAIDLGDVSAVAYYYCGARGFTCRQDAVPVRVVATLALGQSLTLSTPHEAAAPADGVEIVRRADTVLIYEAAAGLTN
jgi:hypothetical protein